MFENIPLAPLTTLGIGGPARWLSDVRTEEELVATLTFAREQNLPTFVLGGGSNLLVSDNGFHGLVLCIKISGIEMNPDNDKLIVSAGAGEPWDEFVSHAIEHGAAGIECLAGIPGTVGGTPVQNVGAYGEEVAETILKVRAFDTHSHQFVDLSRRECGFGYRLSIFNSTQRNRYIVTRVDFKLQRDGAPKVAYKDLFQYFEELSKKPTLQGVSEAVRHIRQSKGMLLVPGETDCRSAGSFFKNPVIKSEQFTAIAHSFHPEKEKIPIYPASDGMVKISAAWLVEQAGFQKGFRLGQAGISSRHSLALINAGDATAAEIIALRDLIRTEVHAKFGITLEQEPVMLGF